MSDLEGKGDLSTSLFSENIVPPDKSAITKPSEDAEKSLELSEQVTKKDEKDGNLISIDTGTVQKGNIVDTKPESNTFSESDQIVDKTALTATELSETTSIEVPSTSKATIYDSQIIFRDTNETLISQETVPKDTTPNIELEESKESINQVGKDNNDDLNDSFDDDLVLKWDDDEKDDEYSTNLSNEALKLLDEELGIEDKIAEIETNTEIAEKITKQSIDINVIEEKDNKGNVDDTKSKIVPIETKETVQTSERVQTVDENTKTLPEVNLSADERHEILKDETKQKDANKSSTTSKAELDINSKALNEKTTVSSSISAADITKEDEIADENAKMEETNDQNQPGLIRDIELKSTSNNDIVKYVHEPDISQNPQITEDNINMDIDTLNIATKPKITPNTEEMDVDLSVNTEKAEIGYKTVEITKLSNVLEQGSLIKIDTTIAIKEINEISLKEIEPQEKVHHYTDIEMTETPDQSLQEIDYSEQIKVKGEKDLSIQDIPIIDKVTTDENFKSTEIKIHTTKLSVTEVPSETKGMKTDLGLNKPDVMLEIPTQELIDIDDFDDTLEIDKDIDSEDNETFNSETNTLTLETKASPEENTNDKNPKLTIEEAEPTTLSKEKDITVTELVKIGTEKEQSVETVKSDKNNISLDANTLKVGDKKNDPIPSDDSVTKSISAVNDNEIKEESSSKVSDDNPIEEPIVKIDDGHIREPTSAESNKIVERMSTCTDDSMTVPTTQAIDDSMTVEPIFEPTDDCITEAETFKVNDSLITKESLNSDDSMTAKVFKENLNMAESVSKVYDDNVKNETSKLDKNITDKPISKSVDGKTEIEDKIIKESSANENMKAEISQTTQSITEEVSKENLESSKLDENITAEPITKAKDDNITKELIVDDNMAAEPPKGNIKTTETASKPDDDMTEEPEISDSLGLLAESSRVMDDDDQDEDDESDDFDQDDESSNLQTAEHSEESNPPSDEAQPEDKDIVVPDESMTVAEEIVYNEDTNTEMDIVDDIVCEETDIVEKVAATVELDIKSTTEGDEISQEVSQPKEDIPSEGSKKEVLLEALQLKEKKQSDETPSSASKSARLSISNVNSNVMTYVELDESSEDEVQEIEKESAKETKQESDDVAENKTVVEELKPKLNFKMTKLNTSEVTIKTGISTKPPLIIPEISNVSEIDKIKDNESKEGKECLEEIFNIDSDTDEEDQKKSTEKPYQAKFNPKCINPMCISPSTDQHYVADAAAMRHFGATKRRAICAPCLASVDERNEALVRGIKDFVPLLELNMEKPTNQLVEISDSESEDESDVLKECKELIGTEGAKMLNEKLADVINDVWQKFNMDDRLKDSENYVYGELKRLEDEGNEINKLLDDCQVETDRIRNELYNTFERSSKSLPPLVIHDTPAANYSSLEKDEVMKEQYVGPYLRNALEEPPAKRQNRGVTQTNTELPKPEEPEAPKIEDDRDISVVLLSAESAPEDLPPPGEVTRPPLRVGMQVHAMRNAFGSWLRGRILDIQPKLPGQQYTHCRVKFDHNIKNPCKVLPARCIAYQEPCDVRMTIGTRVLALFKDSNGKESFYSGVVAEIPNPVNSYRYLVFFDDGYAQYVKHKDTRLVCETKSLVWEEVHPFIRDFVKDYLLKYPERPMVRLHAGQRLNTEWNGKWWTSKVLKVDASLAHVHFEEDNRTEWIYRGSTRLAPLYLELQAAGRSRTRLPRSKAQFRTNMPYVEYMRSEEQSKQQQQLQQEEMIRRQRAVAKKSVSLPQPTPMVDKPDNVTSRVVYYTPKNAVKPHKMVRHTCGPQCRRTDVLSLKELRTYNPLAKPLLSGWERMQVRFKGSKHIMYRAPCGRRIRNMPELHRYLRSIQSDFPVDLFDFNVNTHCLAEFVLHKYNVMKKDLSHGKESVPVPCVNYYDDSLPEFCSYNTERTPTAGVPLNLDPDFLCGCDCEDDCEDKTKCACWKMTLEGARTIGLDTSDVGYVYRRLPEPLPSGIYECNSRCKCKSTCLNRVAQHPLQLKLQVFKTLKRGWGIRALNDVPKGSFLCVYAGNLLTDATANLDGLNEGDEYLAELDYIEVVEQMKEGFEEDIPEADKKLDKKEIKQSSSEEEETESEEDNRDSDKNDKEDGDFQPGYIGLGLTEFNKRLRKRDKKKLAEEQDSKEKVMEGLKGARDDCITISDDEEVREPSRFTAQAGMGAKGFISKYRSVRTLFGKDEACYIMDAKVQGNIGRYLNHSCCPNVFVQNVFVDTHDPRFPWVAFFALSHIRAGTELTWNYNYDIGSVPGKILYCYCGAHNCRGRLL